MRKLIAFILTIFLVTSAFAQTEPADYKKVMTKFKAFYNANKFDSLYTLMGAEMKVALKREQMVAIKAQVGPLLQARFTDYVTPVASYDADFEKGPLLIYVSLNKEGQMVGLRFAPVLQKASTVVEDPDMNQSPVSLKTITGSIAGTLAMPKTVNGKLPVVLIIAGSGPTDRDGNNMLGVSANSYKMIAASLAKNGIASLRYDKRMIGQSVSSTKEKDLRFEDYSDDAIALINMLHTDARFSKVIVMGHSEGSLIGMIASYDQPVNAFISVAGPGTSIDKTLIEQSKAQSQFVQDAFKKVLDSLKAGKTYEKVDPSLYTVFRPSVQPYLISWITHDPAKEIKKLKIPVLIVQGTTDLQVTVADSEKLKKEKKDATLLVIPGMNHVLKDAPADRAANTATYKDAKLPLKPEFVTGMVDFIKKLK